MTLFRGAHAAEQVKVAVDIAAIGTTVGAIMGYMPAIAGFFTALYMAVRFWETRTVQGLVKRLRGRLKALGKE